jgi:hypothetical protein
VWAVVEHLVFAQSTADGEILAIGGEADQVATAPVVRGRVPAAD